MIDYGPGDMVASIYGDGMIPGSPTRPVMVCSVEPINYGNATCNTHGKDCDLLRVGFVDWPNPVGYPFIVWAACYFRKVVQPGAEMDQKVRELEPA